MSENQNNSELLNEDSNETENQFENNADINNIEPEVKEKQGIFVKLKRVKGGDFGSSDSIIKTAMILGILTFMSALILSVLNLLTASVIADRIQSEKANYVEKLFGGEIITEELQGYEDLYINYSAKVLEILYVMDNTNQELAGYCVTVSTKGFGGNIDILVAVNSDCAVIDTVILSMSETAGSGTKIDDDSFKEQFKNKIRNIRANDVNNSNSIDTIANATISSRAFLEGVNTALDVLNDIIDILNSEITITEPVAPVELIPDETEDIAEEITESEENIATEVNEEGE